LLGVVVAEQALDSAEPEQSLELGLEAESRPPEREPMIQPEHYFLPLQAVAMVVVVVQQEELALLARERFLVQEHSLGKASILLAWGPNLRFADCRQGSAFLLVPESL